MNEREQEMVESALRRLEPFVRELQLTGWLPELLVLAPEEIPRVPGFKVALLMPLRTEPARPAESEPPQRQFTEAEARRVARAYASIYADDLAPLDDERNAAYHDLCFERAVASVAAEDEHRQLEHERERQEAEDEERWREEALRDPTSDAYHSDGAREARIDAGLEPG